MEELYDQIGSYVVSCVDDKETLKLMLDELLPLLKQVNYIALDIDSLEEIDKSLGLGHQAVVILSNIVSIYRLNTGKPVATILSTVGINPHVIKVIEEDISYYWIPAGILLMGSGVLTRLQEILNADGKQRSNPD